MEPTDQLARHTSNPSTPFTFAMLLAAVLTVPWLNGSADSLVRPYFYGYLGLSLLVCLFETRLRLRHGGICISLLLVAIVWCGLSLVPFDFSSLPVSATKLRGDLTGQVVGPMSLNPSETRIQLSLLSMCFVVLFLGSQINITPTRVKVIGYGFLANGVALTLFAIVQQATWNGQLYWQFEVPSNHTTFGPMVYHNAIGAYLAICLAIGFVAVSLETNGKTFGQIDAVSGGSLLMFATVALGLLGTLSRGAVLSVFGGLIAMFCLNQFKDTKRWFAAIPVSLFVIGLLFWLGLSGAVAERLASVGSVSALNRDQRLAHWEDAVPVAWEFGGVGSGLGSYRGLVSAYETSKPSGMIFNHAHNQYLETLIVAGIIGLILLLGWIYGAWSACFATMKSNEKSLRLFGAASLFALITQCLHAGIDYCVIIPAIAFTLAFIVALNAAQSAEQTSRRFSTIALALAALAFTGWATYDASTAAKIDSELRRLPWGTKQANLELTNIDQSIRSLESAIQSRPDSMKGQEALAALHTLKYRLIARKELASETGFAESDPNIWQWTSPEILHHRAATLARKNDIQLLAELKTKPMVKEHLGNARAALLRAREADPTWPLLHLRLEELRFLTDDDLIESDENARRIRRLAGNSPTILFECGKREFGAGRYESAYLSWRQSLENSPIHISEIVRLARAHLDTGALLEQVIPTHVDSYIALLDAMRTNELQIDKDVVSKRSTALVRSITLPNDPTDSFKLYRLASLSGCDTQESIKAIEHAVLLSPEKVSWRYEFARALAASERWEEAERHARRCVRHDRKKIYLNLLEQIRKRDVQLGQH